jgi:hypothetical protein
MRWSVGELTPGMLPAQRVATLRPPSKPPAAAAGSVPRDAREPRAVPRAPADAAAHRRDARAIGRRERGREGAAAGPVVLADDELAAVAQEQAGLRKSSSPA